MDIDRARAFLLTLPHATETMQWGDNLVYWVGDKAIGGKMFALINLAADRQIMSYSAGPERFAELVETEGIVPAPYMARIHWVAIEHWRVFRDPDWQRELTTAHALTFSKLPPKVRTALALPPRELKQLIAERRKILAAQAETKSTKSPKKVPKKPRK